MFHISQYLGKWMMSRAIIYPMLGELGGGYGSVELNYELSHTQNCKLKCYPKLVHYLKARNIGVDLPTTVKGHKGRVGALEEMLIELNSDSGGDLCGFCFELVISDTTLSLMQCFDNVRIYCWIRKVCLRMQL